MEGRSLSRRKNITARARILEAASEVYAEQGYRNARIREICDRAGVNIAAVNYHFGDKRRLYDEVLHFAYFNLPGSGAAGRTAGADSPPVERLRPFIESLLTQILSRGRSALYARLVARELADPTPALRRVIDDGIRPQVDSLLSIIRALLPDGVSEQQVRRCAGSVLGQCLYYQFTRPVIEQMGLESRVDESLIEELAEHITGFSLAGLERVAS